MATITNLGMVIYDPGPYAVRVDSGLTSHFGAELRRWRQKRGLSQLALALQARASQRHLSFLETGRTRPRARTVVKLCEVLAVPLRERNHLLALAGLPPMYATSNFDAPPSAPFAAALDGLLEQHEPFPALVINGWWDVVRVNRAASTVFGLLGGRPSNMLEALFNPQGMRAFIDNWDEVAVATLERLYRESGQAPADRRYLELVEFAKREMQCAGVRLGRKPGDALVAAPVFLVDGIRIPTFSVLASFGAARSVTLEELRVELIYPQGSAGETALRELVQARS